MISREFWNSLSIVNSFNHMFMSNLVFLYETKKEGLKIN